MYIVFFFKVPLAQKKKNANLGSKLGKDASKLYIVTCLFNFYAEYIMRNSRLEEVQAGIKISGSNINNLLK